MKFMREKKFFHSYLFSINQYDHYLRLSEVYGFYRTLKKRRYRAQRHRKNERQEIKAKTHRELT